MANSPRALRINAVELLRQPGEVRPIQVTVTGDELDVRHAALASEITIDIELEALNDGVVVRGAVTSGWAGSCRRCLTELTGVSTAPVDELYQVVVLDDDAYPIVEGQLDLAPMARETTLLELDHERLCRADCAGLCPVCGADRNVEPCGCDPTVRDERWAALDGLVLDD